MKRFAILLVGTMLLVGCAASPKCSKTGEKPALKAAIAPRGGIIPPPCFKIHDGSFLYQAETMTAWGNTVPKIGFVDISDEQWHEFNLSEVSVTITVGTCK